MYSHFTNNKDYLSGREQLYNKWKESVVDGNAEQGRPHFMNVAEYTSGKL